MNTDTLIKFVKTQGSIQNLNENSSILLYKITTSVCIIFAFKQISLLTRNNNTSTAPTNSASRAHVTGILNGGVKNNFRPKNMKANLASNNKNEMSSTKPLTMKMKLFTRKFQGLCVLFSLTPPHRNILLRITATKNTFCSLIKTFNY